MSRCIALKKDLERCPNPSERGSIFCRRHRWWWLMTLFGSFVMITTIGANVAQMFGITFPNPLKATPTPTATIAVTFTFTPLPSETPSLVPNEIVFFDSNIYHLGDNLVEDAPDKWLPLDGECKSFNFAVTLPIHEATLNLEIYDADESALIKINGTRASTIPVSSADVTWSGEKPILLPTSLFIDGMNSLEFCSIIGREGLGLDDFQIRNVNVEIIR
jgi:hypothetical protein